MNIKVKFTHPSGKRLALAESFTAFVVGFEASHRVVFDEWLQSLSEVQLNKLREFGSAILDGRQDKYAHYLIDDVVQLALIATCTELQSQCALSADDLFYTVAAMVMASTVQYMVRRGWVEVVRPLSALPNANITIEVTTFGAIQMARETDKCILALFRMAQRKH